MKKSAAVLTLLVLVLLAGSTFAQEWSAAQKEVWKNVETYWSLWAARDAEGHLAYFHQDYLGWNLNSPMPQNKADVAKWDEYEFKTSKVIFNNIHPIAIQIYGNVAFVHYYYVAIIKPIDGEEKSSAGRWTDILLKQGDKWVMIGDHGGQTSKD